MATNAAGEMPYTFRLNTINDKELVYFNLQTTGFEMARDVIQILAKRRNGDVFCCYVKPRKEIEPEASEKSGLVYDVPSDQMKRLGEQVPSFDLTEAMEMFFAFLSQAVETKTANIVLAVQGAKRYHCPALVQAAILCGMLERLQMIVVGFVDTDLLFKGIFPKNISPNNARELKNLYIQHCEAGDVEETHPAAPVLMLEAVLLHVESLKRGDFFDILPDWSVTMEYAVNRETWKVEDVSGKRVFNNDLGRKAAEGGLAYDYVRNIYENAGEERVRQLLGNTKLKPDEVNEILLHLSSITN